MKIRVTENLTPGHHTIFEVFFTPFIPFPRVAAVAGAQLGASGGLETLFQLDPEEFFAPTRPPRPTRPNRKSVVNQ
jgi:hypothetical protein